MWNAIGNIVAALSALLRGWFFFRAGKDRAQKDRLEEACEDLHKQEQARADSPRTAAELVDKLRRGSRF